MLVGLLLMLAPLAAAAFTPSLGASSVRGAAVRGAAAVRLRPGPPSMGMLDKKAPGSKANIGDYKSYQFAKRADGKVTTDDGACFIVPEDETPDFADPSRDWFYCNDPADDEDDMVCELVPEWMGTSPSGDHAVWLCSKPKPE